MSRHDLRPADFDREAIDAARIRPPAEKLLEGLHLFDRTCRVMAAGIAHERPGANSAEILQTLRDRLRIARQLETQ
jgi:hypothetical protein